MTGKPSGHKPKAPEDRLLLSQQTAAFEHAALKILLLLNGGAAVALLAFIGQIWAETRGSEPVLAHIGDAMTGFVCGLILAGVATFSGYVHQQYAYKWSGVNGTDLHRTLMLWARRIAWLLAVLSLLAFAYGCLISIDALTP